MARDPVPSKSSKSAGRPLGSTGENVRKNIRQLRDKKGISGPDLSAKLDALGRPIPPLGIHRIESGSRRVDVDDLVAIALALNVSPLALLLPTEAAPLLPSGEQYSAERIWDWATGRHPLMATDDVVEFIRYSDPLNWPDIEAVLSRELRGMNPSVQGALLSNLGRNKAHRDRRRMAEEASRGDD
jgi:transcriptional regulator with XRE-family HTH domain